MKKVETRYVIETLDKMFADNIEVEVNEEDTRYIRIKGLQEVWRTKEELIQMYKDIIRELKDFNP